MADVLGHADPGLTLRVYAHAMPAEEADLSFADFTRSAPESGFSDDSRRPLALKTRPTQRVPTKPANSKATSISLSSRVVGVVAQARIEQDTRIFSRRKKR